MSEGFLGRWSKRKLDVKQGKEVEAEPLPSPQPSPAGGRGSDETGIPPSPPRGEGRGEGPVDPPLPPTLEDAQALTPASEFKRFAAADVTPEVKNAAMKKLFADPRYNVMDGLDVYTGDYSQPDPIPPSMLRQLASAKFLGLFDREEKEEAAAAAAAQQARDVADNPTLQSVAKSDVAPQAVPEPTDHADPDLRLQQDHAAAGKDPGRGTG
ncbi:MAG: hypothetical protein JWQ07_4123 [Ramlibacter sp.]|nr:hypothetical protein [Ramlibacter sp.]